MKLRDITKSRKAVEIGTTVYVYDLTGLVEAVVTSNGRYNFHARAIKTGYDVSPNNGIYLTPAEAIHRYIGDTQKKLENWKQIVKDTEAEILKAQQELSVHTK